MAAIHTTSEAPTQAIVDLCEHPEIFESLCEEAIAVISENGWTKAALQKLCKMDSSPKESRRLHPPSSTSMHLHVERDVKLSDGIFLFAGSCMMIAGACFDPSVYSSPETFDALRFLNKRL